MSEIALIGKKIGMTREFYKTGQLVPVTVLKMEKARVINIIDKEKRGYEAVQLGYGKIKNSKLTKAMKGYFSKKNAEPKKKLPYLINSTLTPLLAAIGGSTTVARAAIPMRVLMANQPTPDKSPTASITTNIRAWLSETPGRTSN